MMEFLRSLAPHHAHDATRAVAALPSLFESERPLRAVASRAAAPASTSDAREAPDRVPATRDAARAPAPETVTNGRPDAEVPLPAARARSVETQMAAPPEIPARGRSEARAAKGPRDREPEEPPESVQPSTAPRRFIAVPLPLPRRASAAVPVPSSVPVDGQPISRQGLAARSSQAIQERPIVHVTIDRIEVRAPAMPEHPKPPLRARTSSPRETLADYLRARQPAPRGGAK